MTRNTLVLLLVVGLLTAACATEAQRKQEFEANMKSYIAECGSSLGLTLGQPATNEQRTELLWCATVHWAKEELRKGSTDVNVKFVVYLANCDAMLGRDWSEKGEKLKSCLDMQIRQDLELENRAEQMMLLQGLINSRPREQIFNCYTYGNWTQCK